jgi:beta-xylosidase
MRRVFLLAILFVSTLALHAQDYPLTLPSMPLHDPFILADGPSKTYFLYTSNVASLTGEKRRGTMVYESKDLKHWSKPTVVFVPPDDFWAHDGAWAPEVHLYRGHFYLFTTLHNEARPIPQPRPMGRPTYVRGTLIAMSDRPTGPFVPLKQDGPVPPADFMTLDGTLYVDHNNQPWMVYAHEWLQKTDGTIEAIPLKPDLSEAAGPAIHLFKGSDAPWLNAEIVPSARGAVYITDGPELFRTKDGHLLMLWSSYEHAHGVTDAGSSYVQTVARSRSGEIQGPWEQLSPLIHEDSGHGMLFHTFDGRLMLVLHRPFKNARGKIYEMKDAGDHLEVVRERTDLDGDIR